MKAQNKGYRKTTAINDRKTLFKYYKVDTLHSLAVPAGRCECGKITDLYCVECSSYLCEKHIFIDGQDYFCGDCANDNCRELTKKEMRKIRRAELKF